MGRVCKVIVYLAAPIDFDKGSKVTKLKDDIKAHFKEQECVWVYDPAGAWQAPANLVPDEFVHWSTHSLRSKQHTDQSTPLSVLAALPHYPPLHPSLIQSRSAFRTAKNLLMA
jgi:hypothetical protein